MNKRIKTISLLAVMALIIGTFTGCGSSEAAENVQEVVIRVWVPSTDPSPAPLYVALSEGLFEQEFADDNVKIEALEFANGPAANEAFLAGELDVASQIGDQPILIGIQSGVKSVVIGRSMKSRAEGLVVANDSDIETVADLKGKSIAVYIGTSYQKVLLQILQDAGLSESDVEFVNITDANSSIAALSRNEVDAIFITNYQFLTAEENGVGRVIADGTEHSNYAFLEFSQEFYDAYPDLVEKYVRAYKKAEQIVKEDPEKAYREIAEYLEMETDEVKKVVEANDYSLTLDDDTREDFSLTAQFMVDQELIDSLVEDAAIEEHLSDILERISVE